MGNIVSSKNGQSKTSFDDLARETAIETFLRLPVKTLIRSTSVSKTWHSEIRNPDFVSAQIRRSISCCDKNAVLVIPVDISLSDKKYCSLISAETGSMIDKYEIPFNTRNGFLTLIDSVNGVLCPSDICTPCSSIEMYLWNPSIRKYKSLVFSYHQDRCVLGFGFHEPTHDYRVIRVQYRADNEGNLCGKLDPTVEVFSLQMNKWRNIENPTVPQVALECGTTVNSSVYWVDKLRSQTYLEEVCILYFDFNKEVFGQLKLSDDVRYCLGDEALFNLMELEGSLSVCVSKVCDPDISNSNGSSQPCCIWLMRQEDGIISWSIRFRVVLKELGFPYKITRNGTLIMLSLFHEGPDESIMSCDLNSMNFKYLVFDTTLDKNEVTMDTCFIESLVMHVGGDELLKSAK